MTPTQTTTKISHAIAEGKLEAAEKALEEYVMSFEYFKAKRKAIQMDESGVMAKFVKYESPETLYQLFTNQLK